MMRQRILGVALAAGFATSALCAACDVYVVREPSAPPRRRVQTARVAAPPPAAAPISPAPVAPVPPSLSPSLAAGSPVERSPIERRGRVVALHGRGAPSSPTMCLDSDVAAAGDCGALPAPDPGCASPAIARQKCTAYEAYFTPKVAAAALACMSGLSAQQVCDPSQSDNCARGALALACPDPSVTRLCGIAATSCNTSTEACSAIVSGLNDRGKEQVATCISHGCSTGLSACIDALVN